MKIKKTIDALQERADEYRSFANNAVSQEYRWYNAGVQVGIEIAIAFLKDNFEKEGKKYESDNTRKVP